MGRVSVEDLEEGAVLSADVTDNTGKILLRSGTTLTNRHFQTFKIWGIKTISVVGDEVEEAPLEISSEQMEKGAEYARMLLRRNEENHQLIKELQRMITERVAQNLAKEEQHVEA